jgi:hypothetical protein
MTQADGMRARVEGAGDLAGLLAAGRDAFGLLLDACRDGQDRPGGLFAAFAFASAAAAQGRLVLASAPSLPAGQAAQASHDECVSGDLETVADGLAGLAQVLGGCLSAAARQAGNPGDREACEDAAVQAARVAGLLAPDR